MKRLTNEIVLKKFKLVHGNRYSYPDLNYKGIDKKIEITCKKHGIFKQSSYKHINGSGCPKCNGGIKSNIEEFIEKSNKIHNFEYTYPDVFYINNHTNVKITCKKHGTFEQLPLSHLSGCGCPKCGCNLKPTNEEFINKVNKIHNFKYQYPNLNYINNHTKIDIICLIHGLFKQSPDKHLSGNGCPICQKGKHTSFPEQILFYYFSKLGITIENRKKVNDLEIDVYIDQLKLGIEYDGSRFHKNNEIRDQKKVDKLKSLGINIIRIREEGLNEINNCLNFIKKNKRNDELEKIIPEIIYYINKKYNKNFFIDINLKRDFIEIISSIKEIKVNNSLLNTHPEVARKWHPIKNGTLKPEYFTYGSNVKIWWLCDKEHEFKQSIYSFSKNIHGCSQCLKINRYNNKSN